MKQEFRGYLLARDFTVFAGVVLFAIVLFSSWFTVHYYNEYSSRISSDLQDRALHVGDVFTDDIEYVAYQMEFLGKQIVAGDLNDLESIYKLLSFSKTSRKVNISTTWNMFTWVNEDLYIVADGDAGVLKTPKDLSHRDYIPETEKEPWKFHIGKPVYGAVSKQWILPGGMGFTQKRNKYAGAIVFGFEIDSLVNKLAKALNSKGTSFVILNKDNDIIVSSENNKVLKRNSPTLEKYLSMDKKSREGMISTRLFPGGGGEYAHYAKLDKYPFTIIVSYDKDLAFSEIESALISRVVEFSIIIAVVFVLLWLVRVRLVNPVVAVSGAVEKIVNGQKICRMPRGYSIEINSLVYNILRMRRAYSKEKIIRKKLERELKEINGFDEEPVNKKVLRFPERLK